MQLSQNKDTKEIQFVKKEENLSVFKGSMAVYVENPMESMKKLQEVISEVSQAGKYKLNIQN